MTGPEQRLRDHFGALPQVAPPPTLGKRICMAHRTRVRRLRVGALGLALAVACIAVVPMLLHEPFPATPETARAVVLDQDKLANVRALDHALQTAYERSASDDEIAPLWAARAKLLDPSATPVGI